MSIPAKTLRTIARGRVKDAEALFQAKRYSGAFYMVGYAVECALKARITRTLKWDGFPQTGKEFEKKKSLQVHDFDALMQFTGCWSRIQTNALAEWSTVKKWSVEHRYKPLSEVTRDDASNMIFATKCILRELA